MTAPRTLTCLALALALIAACDSGPVVDPDLTGVVVDADGAPAAGVAVGVVYRFEGLSLPGDWDKTWPDKPQTGISFDLPEAAHVLLTILTWDRRPVRVTEADLPAGINTFIWDATDDAGDHVPSGMYIAIIEPENGDPTETELFLYYFEPAEIHRAPHAVTDERGRFRIRRALLPIGAEFHIYEDETYRVSDEIRVLGVVQDGEFYPYGAVVTDIPEDSEVGAYVRIVLGQH